MVLYINENYLHHSLHGELVSKLAELDNEITVNISSMYCSIEAFSMK